jgi:hypothetical protein
MLKPALRYRRVSKHERDFLPLVRGPEAARLLSSGVLGCCELRAHDIGEFIKEDRWRSCNE